MFQSLGAGRNTIVSDNVVNNTKNTIIAGEGSDSINISSNDNFINAGSGKNYISLGGGQNNTIVAGGGRDTISLDETSSGNVIVFGGGNDVVYNYHDSDSVAAIGTLAKNNVGNDVILSDGISQMILKGAADKTVQTTILDAASDAYKAISDNSELGDSLLPDGTEDTTSSDLMEIVLLTQRGESHSNTVDSAFIQALGGNDTISNSGENVSIEGGKGNDKISLVSGSENTFISYNAGDGNDTISGFNSDDTLSISGGKYHLMINTVFNDVIIAVNNSFVLLQNAAALSSINVDGTLADVEDILTINNSMPFPVIIEDETEIIDASKRTLPIIIGGSHFDNSIVGGKGNDTLSGGGGDNTLTGGAGNDEFDCTRGNYIITDYTEKDYIRFSYDYEDYEIDGKDLIFNFDNGNSLTVIKGAGKVINSNLGINCYVTGALLDAKQKSATISADTNIFNATPYSKLVTINGSMVEGEIEIIGNKKANRIIAGNKDTTLNGGKGNDTLWGGDGEDVFVYAKGDGKDVINNYSTGDEINLSRNATIKDAYMKSGNAVIKIDSGSITVKEASDKKIIFVQNEIETIFSAGVFLTEDTAKVFSSFKDSINLADYEDISNVDAALAKKKLTINGDDDNNSLQGGKGDDSLWGGDGSDTFIYQAGTGNDVIADYTEGDMLQIIDKRGKITAFKTATFTSDTLTLNINGGGSVTFKNVDVQTSFNINGESYHVSGNSLTK